MGRAGQFKQSSLFGTLHASQKIPLTVHRFMRCSKFLSPSRPPTGAPHYIPKTLLCWLRSAWCCRRGTTCTLAPPSARSTGSATRSATPTPTSATALSLTGSWTSCLSASRSLPPTTAGARLFRPYCLDMASLSDLVAWMSPNVATSCSLSSRSLPPTRAGARLFCHCCLIWLAITPVLAPAWLPDGNIV